MDPLARLMPVPPTSATAGGCLQNVPTPTVCGNYNRKGSSKTSGDGLATWARSEQVGGTLNPEWVEWLMGWPIGQTELDASVMDKSR